MPRTCADCAHFAGDACDHPVRVRYGMPFDPDRPCPMRRPRQAPPFAGPRARGGKVCGPGGREYAERKVVRDDFKVYASVVHAAWDVSPSASPGNIAKAADGRQATAYGRRWCWMDEMGVGDEK